ncbi:Alpha-galactosidase [Parageobacillus caldoxylosilyticus]|uniref:Alpha-galactosidase n=1 Tax=Saccharococcus caldoxylosilyticus TaxID=81408 RepID=A0A150KVG9_9BACL|nr:Alpha-galactosidase [Parageobacillus caldoxylosilyticus]
MGITYDPNMKMFHLQANDMSYMMQLVVRGYLAHFYWGKKNSKSEWLTQTAVSQPSVLP